MRYLLPLLFCSIIIFSCQHKTEETTTTSGNVEDKIALLETDKAFSKMSMEKGMKQAFLEYMDSNGVLLRPNHAPIIGANAVDFLIAQNDADFSMEWQPQNAVVSAAGDLGYTYGVYSLHPKAMDTVLYGTYVSIWARQPDGSWKFALDSGNEGVDSNNVAF